MTKMGKYTDTVGDKSKAAAIAVGNKQLLLWPVCRVPFPVTPRPASLRLACSLKISLARESGNPEGRIAQVHPRITNVERRPTRWKVRRPAHPQTPVVPHQTDPADLTTPRSVRKTHPMQETVNTRAATANVQMR
jgi:hypothetical protein